MSVVPSRSQGLPTQGDDGSVGVDLERGAGSDPADVAATTGVPLAISLSGAAESGSAAPQGAPPSGVGVGRSPATVAPSAHHDGGVLPADDGHGSSAEADVKAARGLAMLLQMPRFMSVRRQRVVYAVQFFNFAAYIVIGVIMLHVFDAQHVHYTYPFLFGGATYVVMGASWIASAVPPEFWERIAAFRAAGPAVVELHAARRTLVISSLISNWVAVGLFCTFVLSDLNGRGGGEHATPELQWAAAATYVFGQLIVSVHFLNVLVGGTCTLPVVMSQETALQLLLAVVTKFADAVEAGMPVVALEDGLLVLRELMAMLRGSVLSTVFAFVSFAVWLLASIAVCVLEPEPPAFFIVLVVVMVMSLFVVPLTAARVDAQLRRIPVALSVRACRAGSQGRAGARAAAASADHWRRVDGHLEGGGTRRRDLPGAGDESATQSTGVNVAADSEAGAAGVLDLLQTRIEKMRLGWYILGTPVNFATLGRVRAVVTALLLLVVRSWVGL